MHTAVTWVVFVSVIANHKKYIIPDWS